MIGSGKNENGNRARDLGRGSYLFRVTEDILVAMEDLGVSKSELAKKLGISKSRISQLLRGSSNMTIGTLSDIAYELGLSLDKTFKEYSAQRDPVDEVQSGVQSIAINQQVRNCSAEPNNTKMRLHSGCKVLVGDDTGDWKPSNDQAQFLKMIEKLLGMESVDKAEEITRDWNTGL